MTGFVEVGVSYCVLHHGLVDEGDRCDFADMDLDSPVRPCVLRPLGYQQGDKQ